MHKYVKCIKHYSHRNQDAQHWIIVKLLLWKGKRKDYKLCLTLFKVIEIKYVIVTVKSDDSNTYTHHITFYKKVNRKGTETKLTTVGEQIEPKQYRKHNRNQVKNWYF